MLHHEMFVCWALSNEHWSDVAAANMWNINYKPKVFRDVMLCWLPTSYWCDEQSQLPSPSGSSSYYDLSKHQQLFTNPHGITSQRIWIFSIISVKTSNLINVITFYVLLHNTGQQMQWYHTFTHVIHSTKGKGLSHNRLLRWPKGVRVG